MICKWIVDAWAGVRTDVIKKSFEACGISLSLCGGQDNEISVFKAGRQCEAGLEMLKAAAAEEKQEFEEDPYEEEHLLADSEDKDDKIVEQDDGDISDDYSPRRTHLETIIARAFISDFTVHFF